MARPGRPTDLTPERMAMLVNCVRAGMTRARAAAACGIDESTFYSWMRAGAEGKSPEHVAFREAVQSADAEGEARLVTLISKSAEGDDVRLTEIIKGAGDGDTEDLARLIMMTLGRPARDPVWQAAAWLLERKWPERWAQRTAVDVKVNEQLSIALDRLKGAFPEDTYRRILSVIAGGDGSASTEGAGVVERDGEG